MVFYIPKVKYNGTTYVFLGLFAHQYPDLSEAITDPKSHKKLENVLGSKYKSVLALDDKDNVKYIHTCIWADDNVNMFRKKVCIALKLKDISKTYFWYKRNIKGDPAFIYFFISQVFKKSKAISYDTFCEAAKTIGYKPSKDNEMNMITKAEASKILFELNLKKVDESLCFHYTYDGYMDFFNADPSASSHDQITNTSSVTNTSNLSRTLESFDVVNDIFYLTTSGDKIYFPLTASAITEDDKKLITTLNDLEIQNATGDLNGVVSNSIIHHVFLKGNDIPGINGKVDLELLFNNLKASPFVKYKTPLNVYYKVDKTALTTISHEDMAKWTKIPMNKDDKSFIVVKLLYKNHSHVSLQVNEDLSFHIKLNLGIKEGENISKVSQILATLVSPILKLASETYKEYFIPTELPKDILIHSSERDLIRVVQVVSSTISQTKNSMVNHSMLSSIVKQHFYPYFNIVHSPDPNVLHLQYKKISNYTKLDNISSYVLLNSRLSRDDLVLQVINTFLVSKEEAEREVDGALMSISTNSKVKKSLYDISHNYVNIKIRLSASIDMRYMVNGSMINGSTLQKIDDLLSKLVLLAEKTKKLSKKNIADVLEQLEKKTIVLDTQEVQELIEEDEVDISEDLDDELLALQVEFDTIQEEKPKEPVLPPPPSEPSKPPSKVKGYILSKLYEADKQLFEYKPPADVKRRDYASLCGWVDRRQPVVISKEELERIEKEFPGAINGHVRSGSTLDLQKKNHYICPKVWCPKSRVALTFEAYEKYGRKCPYPEVDEEPILFASKSFFGEGNAGLKKERYPGYLDKYIHPEQLCLPCCFKVKPSEGNRNKQRGDLCVLKEESEQPVVLVDGPVEKYIKNSNYSPLEVGRFGLLPPTLVEFLAQSQKQGNRHDGTGSISDATNAVFRQGIQQTGQSYLDAMVVVLDNENIASVKDLLKNITENLDVLTYLSIENGRIMKMFADTSKTVYEDFSAFYDWFKKQKKYIQHMNLSRLLIDIEKTGKTPVFDVNKLRYHHEILREYIIYKSYQNFLQYLSNDRIVKDHIVLSDLICNHLHKHININKHNIIVLDYIVETEKIYIACNVNKDKPFNMDYPFVFLWKRNQYYEPLVHVKQQEGSMDTNIVFASWKRLSKELKQIVNFANKNCIINKYTNDYHNIEVFLRNIDFRIKYHVIDYGYKLCGFIVNHNMYLPLPQRKDFHYESGIRYVYISDVPNFKCFLEQKDITAMYIKLKQFAPEFPLVSKFVDDGSGMILDNDMFVPLNMKAKDVQKRLTFKNGLFLLVGSESYDRRQELYSNFDKEAKLIDELAIKIKNKMGADTTLTKQVSFLIDKHNPLPLSYKMSKLKMLFKDIMTDNKTWFKLLEYLKPSSRHFKMYRRRTMRFTLLDNELLFDHNDVLTGRLQQAVDLAENPHKAFLQVLDKHYTPEFVFDDHVEDSYNDILSLQSEDVPVKWRKVLRSYNVKDNQDAYNPRYMMDLMKRISMRNGRKGFDDSLYRVAISNMVTEAYKKQSVVEIFDNPWLVSYYKKTKIVQSLENTLEVYGSPHYYPSVFDIKVMGKLAGVNLCIIGRKTTKNPDGLEVIFNRSDLWIILAYVFERFQGHDRFSFYVHDEDIYFTTNNLPSTFIELISKKMYEYNVNVIDDDPL